MTLEHKQKSIMVSIMGQPNAGKSTLLNQILGFDLSIVSPKVQTTRTVIKGIYMHCDTQIIFVDTPGLFEPDNKLEHFIVNNAKRGMFGPDLILFLIDIRFFSDKSLTTLREIKQKNENVVVVLNKIDIGTDLDNATIKELSDIVSNIFYISALRRDGIDHLLNYIDDLAPVLPWPHDPDSITTTPIRSLAADITMQQIFLLLSQELPYKITVEPLSWKEVDDKVIIHQDIIATTEAHKKIIIGAGGSMIKKIGSFSRQQIEATFNIRADLFLFVKIKDWMERLI